MFCLLVTSGAAVFAQTPSAANEAQNKGLPTNDLDAFMAKVLERREIDWDRLHNYVFSERETLEIKTNRLPALENIRKEYVWRVKDGYIVRTPVKANGVSISKDEQARAENEWIEQQKRRKSKALERESFFGFKFQPGRYLYAGKKTVENRELTVIEYYPDFKDLDDDQGEGSSAKLEEKEGKKEPKQRDSEEEYYERMFEKAFVATMLVDPQEHQLVEMTFDNVGLDFLPARWLVRVSDIKASLRMDKPYGDVWLPKTIQAWGSVSTAYGDLSLRYSREFFDYKRTDVKVKFWYERPSAPKTDNK
jgi:hypothetical protein